MPQIKIDYVVSFSSEDPEHPARGLARGAADGSGRWLCARAQPGASASVLLQLAHAAQISRVTVGAHHAALVEVLAGRSETPDEPFRVLVPSSLFVSAQESRRAEGVQRVRSFHGEQLAGDARDGRYDRLRVVVSQPYNKHCQYGLSFVHLFEPEEDAHGAGGALADAAAAPAGDAGGAGEASDDDEFRPGELFAQHRDRQAARATESTDTQIRRASALARNSIADPAVKLTKTPIGKGGGGSRTESARTERDEVRRATGEERAAASDTSRVDRNKRKRPDGEAPRGSSGEKRGKRERADAGSVLRGVVFALSGYVNPRRAAVRDAALRLGARYRPDWGPGCTHLVCAFPDTPKLRALRTAEAAEGARAATVVTADWIERCAERCERLPWRRFATEPARQGDAPDSDGSDDDARAAAPRRRRPSRGAPARRSTSDSDTDDEIGRALARRERPSSPVDGGDDSDGTLVAGEGAGARGGGAGALPPLFEGRSFALGALPPRMDAALLRRYVRAYGGVVLEVSGRGARGASDECPLQAQADHVLCAAAGAEGRVRADWVWRCHELRALAPLSAAIARVPRAVFHSDV